MDEGEPKRDALKGVVVGHSRDGRCLRIIKFGYVSTSNYHYTFYKKTKEAEKTPISSWLLGEAS
jgi:hypothetical protein